MKSEPQLSRPADLLAGFIAVRPDPGVPELVMAGEQWAPGGQFIAEHSHPVWEFYLQVDGDSAWRADHRTHRLRPGTLLVVAPNVAHRMSRRQAAGHHYYFAAIDLRACRARIPDLPHPLAPDRVTVLAGANGPARAFATLVREVTLVQPSRPIGLRLAVDSLVLETWRILSYPNSPPRAIGWHPGVERVVTLVQQQPGRAWNVRALARLAGLSEGHLTERFVTDVGTTPHRFVLQTRLERARDSLEHSDVSVTQLAQDLGFASSQHLATAFHRRFGRSPTSLRRT
jgi:AraC-like DNA-binding protein